MSETEGDPGLVPTSERLLVVAESSVDPPETSGEEDDADYLEVAKVSSPPPTAQNVSGETGAEGAGESDDIRIPIEADEAEEEEEDGGDEGERSQPRKSLAFLRDVKQTATLTWKDLTYTVPIKVRGGACACLPADKRRPLLTTFRLPLGPLVYSFQCMKVGFRKYEQKTIVGGISGQVKGGQMVAIMGTSGAGRYGGAACPMNGASVTWEGMSRD